MATLKSVHVTRPMSCNPAKLKSVNSTTLKSVETTTLRLANNYAKQHGKVG